MSTSWPTSLPLRDLIWSLPDSPPERPLRPEPVRHRHRRRLGHPPRAKLDNGRVLVKAYLLPDGPAAKRASNCGPNCPELNRQPVQKSFPPFNPWSLPFSADHTLRLSAASLHAALSDQHGGRGHLPEPGDDRPTTVTLTSIPERVSFAFSSFNAGLTGAEQPSSSMRSTAAMDTSDLQLLG
ncbi:MAG: hypothetical protein IPK19_13205 [Chloroflexi bacterium]|nr:hypothetical protein [Chloroflexota bacterium]